MNILEIQYSSQFSPLFLIFIFATSIIDQPSKFKMQDIKKNYCFFHSTNANPKGGAMSLHLTGFSTRQRGLPSTNHGLDEQRHALFWRQRDAAHHVVYRAIPARLHPGLCIQGAGRPKSVHNAQSQPGPVEGQLHLESRLGGGSVVAGRGAARGGGGRVAPDCPTKPGVN